MKILHVYKDYHPILGGIEGHIRTLAEGQAAAGNQVTVLVTNPNGHPQHEQRNGVSVVRLNRVATVASSPISPGFFRYLLREDPDITHLHYPNPLGEISQFFAGRERPYVITYHSDIIRSSQKFLFTLYRPLMRRILKAAGRVLATSHNYLNSSQYLRLLVDNCEVIHLGIDPSPYLAAARLYPARVHPRLFFLGRHRYYKGLEILLEALIELEAELWVGGDGEMRFKWMNLAAELGVSERVRFLGDIPAEELPGIYASADLFILPSTLRAEAFGIVLLEAMASALPCITTELGTGTSFIVQDGLTGLVVPPNSPQELATAINELLQNPDLRAHMGSAGRERVLKEFTVERMLDQVEMVYLEVIKE